MSIEKMSAKEYNFWASAIKTANDLIDKDASKKALQSVHLQLAAKYGYSDDVRELLKKFRYNV